MLTSRVTFVVVLIAALGGASWASIETEPVKVTHRNSGPRYDVDDVERTRLTPDSRDAENQVLPARFPMQSQRGEQPDTPPGADGEPAHIGHVSIRRIFLVPMMEPAHHSNAGFWSGGVSGPLAASGRDEQPEQPSPPVSMFGGANKPFWPFAPPSRHHLFGSDQASRSPTPEASNESPQQQPAGEMEGNFSNERPRPRTDFDPLQMMIELMQQALNPPPANNFFNDLNKEASGSSNDNDNNNKDKDNNNDRPGQSLLGELDRPVKPQSNNETREEIVEIDGKKYLRKTMINRHVGENIIFMTKRLIFVPLNETDGSELTTTTTTVLPSSPAKDATTPSSEPEKSKVEPTTTTTTTTAASTTEAATSEPSTASINGAAAASEMPSTPTTTTPTTTTTPASTKEETTPNIHEKLTKMYERVISRAGEELPVPKSSEAPKSS